MEEVMQIPNIETKWNSAEIENFVLEKLKTTI